MTGVLQYEYRDGPGHHYLICRACGEVAEVNNGSLKNLTADLEHQHGFHVEPDHLALVGLCQRCLIESKAAPGLESETLISA